MSTRRLCTVITIAVILSMSTALHAETPLSANVTYQGLLELNGMPVSDTADFVLYLYDAEIGGSQIGSSSPAYGIAVFDGLFTLDFDFGDNAFNGDARWLEIVVRSPAGSGIFTTLSPRQPLTATPYALFALDGGAASPWEIAGNDIFYDAGNVGIGLSNPAAKLHIGGTPYVDGIMFPDGSLQTTAATSGGGSWSLTGNAGTTPGVDFLGTIDDMPLELHVNGIRALRIEPSYDSPNLVGGYSGNTVGEGVTGATIAGGGAGAMTNRVTDEGGAIGGGMSNQTGNDTGTTIDAANATVAGGYGNTASGLRSTVSGGRNNTASGTNSAIGGGSNNSASDGNTVVSGGGNNSASGYQATIAGGSHNTASGGTSVVGGGEYNTANGYIATIPGGSHNEASGSYSLAAGQRAQAIDAGTFVWSDSTTVDPDFFYSTGPDQFLIKATGGVGINTNSPGAALHIGGTPDVDGIMFPDGTLQTTAATSGGAAGGDLAGTYPNPSVVRLRGLSVSSVTPQNGDVLTWSGSYWTPLDADLSLPYWDSTSSAYDAFRVTNNGSGDGIMGLTDGLNARGVEGIATATSGNSYGVYGETASTGGRGVKGHATANSGVTFGVIGETGSSDGRGVFGWATATTGDNIGVVGESDGDGGIGVLGRADASSGTTYGLKGLVNSPGGTAVYGEATAASGSAYGIHGVTESTSGKGVWGDARATSGTTTGVFGSSSSPTGNGVLGANDATSGVSVGVAGAAVSPSGYGVQCSGDLRVFGDISVTGSKAGYVTDIVVNGGAEDLECGDVVDIIGVAEPIMGDVPVIVVQLSRTKGSRSVLGPVDCALTLTEVGDEESSPLARLQYKSQQFHAHHREGTIGPGEYGRVVTLGAFKSIKVDADRTPVRPGDLLVSSSTPGFAVAISENEDAQTGTVVGKALAAVDAGRATIPVLVQPR